MAAVYGDALAKLARMDVLVVGMTGTGAETGTCTRFEDGRMYFVSVVYSVLAMRLQRRTFFLLRLTV